MTQPTPAAMALAEASLDVDEGCILHPYQDCVGVWTIGTGLTRINGVAVTAHTAPITLAEDHAFVGFELAQTAKMIASVVKVPLTDGQWAALANFAYNVGGHAFITSTLLKLLNTKNYAAASLQFLVWDRAGGRVVAGLTARRRRTMTLFNRKQTA